jgi:DNA-binding NarL/FixJ family response regulator
VIDAGSASDADSSSDTISVLLVDDQELVRAGFRIILESEPGISVLGEAADGAAALEQARRLHPDIICMDVQMPGVDGLEATRRIVADAGLRSSVLMLTTFDRDDYLFAALGAGASGFLLKNASPEDLINAIRVLARGDALLSPEVTRRVIGRFAGAARRATDPSPMPTAAPTPGHGPGAVPAVPRGASALSTLTDREAEVLGLLAQGRSNAEIASELYLGEATVKTHVSKILMKLEVRDRIQAVVYAYENGIVRSSP